MLSKRQYVGLVAIMVFSGLAGGGGVAWVVASRTLPEREPEEKPSAEPRVVKARELRIVDAQGRTRVKLGPGESEGEEMGLHVLDDHGNHRACLVMKQSLQGLKLQDADGAPHIWIGGGEAGEKGRLDGLTVVDDEGVDRVVIGSTSATGPVVVLSDEGDNPRASVTSTSFTLHHMNALPSVLLGADENGRSVLAFTRESGKPQASFSGRELSFYDEKLAPRLSMKLDEAGGPSLQLADAKGDALWKAPTD